MLSLNLDSKNKTLKKIFYGEYSNIIVTKDYVLTFSKYLRNNKFEVLLFKNNKKIFSFDLDLFISDYEIINDNIIILAGSNINNENHFVIAIDCENRKKIEIVNEKKKDDFLKILPRENFIYIYNSSMPHKNSNKYIYKINKQNYRKIFVKDFDIKEKKYYYLYGKGFFLMKKFFYHV